MPLEKPKKLRKLSRPEAAYIAGLIDGEGTVTLTRKHKSEYRQLSISISSNERPMLEHIKFVTGVGKITNKRTSKPHHASSYSYAVYNRQALALLHHTLPFLKSYKRKRSRLILDKYLELTPRNGKYTPELLLRKKAFERKVLALKANQAL